VNNLTDILVLVVIGLGIGVMLDSKNKGGQDAKDIIAKLKDVEKKNDSLNLTDLAKSANEFLLRNKRPRR
jgi:hypothetical protein